MSESSESNENRNTNGNDIKIAYSGIEGSFAHIAATRIFPDLPLFPCHSFKEAYEKVASGICEAAVLPIENSYAGDVGQVSDLMFGGDLLVYGVYELSISQCLLGIPGSDVASIRRVISHPQALEQCAEYIANHHWETIPYENTARAAREVARSADPSTGAIASAETAPLYDLCVLAEGINESSRNTTRFAVFVRSTSNGIERIMKKEKENENTILLFTIKHVAGSLAKAVSIIGQHDFNMRVIRSRPVKDINWQYYFYTELEGRLDTPSGKKMLEDLKSACELIKIVGTYHPEEKI
ncbi:MAG: bifunctional chorismate mutase/prephenate dehydratase [Clostridiales bacterium]|nr:bifunctional chorismate mutase/prephenate dehydratase [Clostridiales bacterium]